MYDLKLLVAASALAACKARPQRASPIHTTHRLKLRGRDSIAREKEKGGQSWDGSGREPKVEKAGDLVGHAPFAYKRPIYAPR
jgi:hypothetical protein